jgi:hypothetical protein
MTEYNNLKVDEYGDSPFVQLRIFEDRTWVSQVVLVQRSPIEAEAPLSAGGHTENAYVGYVIERKGEYVCIRRYGLSLPNTEHFVNYTVGYIKAFGGEADPTVDKLVEKLFDDLDSGKLGVGDTVPKKLARYLHRLWMPQKRPGLTSLVS